MTIREMPLPDFGAPDAPPELPAATYRARLLKLRERMRAAGLDALLVYADREHSANISYCTGFDPRFEEALFILTAEGQATLCLGNECINIVSRLPIPAQILLCQEFSLMGQDRARSWDLKPLLPKAGLRAGMRCGIAGWKALMAGRIEVPAYIVDLVTEACGARPVNASGLFMDPRDGLRIRNEPEQLPLYEYAAARTSASVLNILRALKPGARCFDLARHFSDGGLPLSCHSMLACGREIPNGMASPGAAVVREGEFLTCAMGVWGSLTCRAGMLVANPAAFDNALGRDTIRLIGNYLGVVKAWYAALRVGVTAGEVWAAAEAARDDSLYTFCVNTGHYIHLDEWVSSPFWKGSDIPLPSGCAVQADIIPVSRRSPISVNMEDGLLLADAALRAELDRVQPALMGRCRARRQFMVEALGYELSEDVLPLGNYPGAYFPCLLDTGRVCRVE
jgi:hypothetical protein